jgi:hypothetical protein
MTTRTPNNIKQYEITYSEGKIIWVKRWNFFKETITF